MTYKNFIKTILIIFSNIILAILLCLFLNWIAFKFIYPRAEGLSHSSQYEYTFDRQIMPMETLKELYPYKENKIIDNKKLSKKPIIMFGSFIGYGVDEEESLQQKLSQSLNRPVYNFSSMGSAPQIVLMDIRNHIYDDVIKKSEYCILVESGEHVWRIYTQPNGYPYDYLWPRYDIKKGNLVLHTPKHPNIEGSFLYKTFQKIYFAKILSSNNIPFIQNYLFNNVLIYYKAIKDEIKAINPDIKFIIIAYPDKSKTKGFMTNKKWTKLRKYNIKVVNVSKRIPEIDMNKDGKYENKNNGQPTSEAWDLILTHMIKKNIID